MPGLYILDDNRQSTVKAKKSTQYMLLFATQQETGLVFTLNEKLPAKNLLKWQMTDRKPRHQRAVGESVWVAKIPWNSLMSLWQRHRYEADCSGLGLFTKTYSVVNIWRLINLLSWKQRENFVDVSSHHRIRTDLAHLIVSHLIDMSSNVCTWPSDEWRQQGVQKPAFF